MRGVSNVVAQLSVEERAILWAMRVWVLGRHHDIGAAARIQDVMDRLGAEEAAAYLDGFMLSLGQGAKRRIDVHCACHTRVEADERLLLDVLSLAQKSRSLEALLLLRSVVHDKAAAGVLRCAQGVVTELAFAGQYLNAPPVEMPVPDKPCDLQIAAAVVSQTIH